MEHTTSLASPDTFSASQELAGWQQERTSSQLQTFIESKLQRLANELELGLEVA